MYVEEDNVYGYGVKRGLFSWSDYCTDCGKSCSLTVHQDDPAVVEEDTCEFMEEPAPVKNQKGDSNGNRQKIKKIIKKKGSNKQKSTFSAIEGLHVAFKDAAKSNEGVIIQRCLAAFLLVVMYIAASGFKTYCWQLAPQLSNPSIMMKGRLGDGNEVIVDDYREGYWWLRDNTPQDSRIMAWWDYGYQITAIANRTTIADGNTWNHEHIALLGKALTTTEDEGYEIARHLADYVLIWAGGGGDDLAKSPHLARIANSVYRDHCSDPACRGFGFTDRQGTPSVMMERSFLYKLHGHNMANGVKANARYFQEVFRSKYGKVRIFKILGVSQESKDWVANPENRLCDVPGSWYCPGQYPPGLQDILSRKTDFAQLEDFNRGNRGQSDEQYQKEYFEALANPKKAVDKAREWEVSREKKVVEDAKKNPVETQEEEPKPKPTQEQINEVNGKWENSEASTLMWELITNGQIDSIEAWLKREPLAAFVRSEDGRGPMWWAFESRNQEIVKLLMRAGVSHGDTDKYGKKPASLLDP
uniref:STT3/PglB/AglB core domain-containing protein n=1 Tax=Attheya septentrionalis TaxID=420275 RepID=A0A7S2XHW6_9STRA|mmetsp:Transcript_10455/g.19056  ORF Transcript_10455/g.19056 Transcript_10455/m.19056 type:complete len:529 (+) Transcript_10455:318-1904(+)